MPRGFWPTRTSPTTWSLAVSITLSVPEPSLGRKRRAPPRRRAAPPRASPGREGGPATGSWAIVRRRHSRCDAREDTVALDQRVLDRHGDVADDQGQQGVAARVVQRGQERIGRRPVRAPRGKVDTEEAHAVLAEV